MSSLLRFVFLLFFALAPGVPLATQDSPGSTNFSADIARIIEEEMRAQNAPGAAVAIVFNGEVIFAEGFGVRNTETNDSVTPDTLFMFGSTLKPLTSIGLLRLVESGGVDLDAPVSLYLPEIAFPDTVLVRHLLSHTTGLSDDANGDGPRDPAALRESMARFTRDSFFAPAGELHSYSNPGFDIAGAVIESVSGQYYADYMAAEVFAPMGMTRATFDPNVAITYPVAVGYQRGLLGNNAVRRNASHTTEAPSGLAYASVNDLTKLIEFVLNEGQANGQTILTNSMAEAMWTPAAVSIVSPMRYGLGFFIEDYRGTVRVGHGGNVDGYSSMLETLPEYGLGVVVLANSSGFDANPIFDAVVDALIDLPATSESVTKQPAIDLEAYAGSYALRDLNGDPSFTVTVTVEGERLLAQVAGQPPLTLRAAEQDLFEIYFGEIATGQKLAFLRDDTGTITYIHAGGRAGTRITN